jgi:hypothetical protein
MPTDDLTRLAELAERATPTGECYREGTRVYVDGHLLVDTYTGMRAIKSCEALAEFIVAAHNTLTTSRLRQLAAVEAERQWLPIELAPKDGESLLLYGRERCGIGYYDECEPQAAKNWPWHWGFPWKPTHFRPLPPFPGTTT